MKILRLDHVGIIVNDLAAARAFFLDFGLEIQGEAEMQGELLDQLLGLHGVHTKFVTMGPPDGQATLELIQFVSPADENGIQPNPVNAPGIRHIAFAVEDIEALVDKLKKKGMEVFSAIQNYENMYKLCYVRGPEGIILDLAEKIG